MKSPFSCLLAFLLILGSALRAEDIRFPADGGFINVRNAPYSAAGDGVADDTDALQAAIWAACDGGGRMVYLPNGIYRVTRPLEWRRANNGIAVVQGQSEAGVVIRLDDHAPGFGDPAQPRRLIWTGSSAGLNRFGNTLRHLTIDTGDNPGAIAIRYVTHNIGRLERVTIRGNGVKGIDMAWDDGDIVDENGNVVRDRSRGNGPGLLKRVTVEGFRRGIATDGGPFQTFTLEHVTLRNQTEFGLHNGLQLLAIRGLVTTGQRGPSVFNGKGSIVLIDASLGGDPAHTAGLPALENTVGVVFARNLTSSGYAQAVADPENPVAGSGVEEWYSKPALTLDDAARRASLNLPVEETPEPDVLNDDPGTWLNIDHFYDPADGLDFSDAFERAMAYSAAHPQHRTIYVPGTPPPPTSISAPGGSRVIRRQIHLRGNIQRILGVDGHNSRVNFGNFVLAENPTKHGVVMDDDSPDIVIWNLDNRSVNAGHQLVNRSSHKTLVMLECLGQATDLEGTGRLFFENFSNNLGHSSAFEFRGGGSVWARNLNPEGVNAQNLPPSGIAPAHVLVEGSTAWLLGMKLEYYGSALEARDGARAELLGGGALVNVPYAGYDMIVNHESAVSATYTEITGYNAAPYTNIVRETQAGATAIQPRSTDHQAVFTLDDGKRPDEGLSNNAPGSDVSLYAGYRGIYLHEDFADGNRTGRTRASASTASVQGGLTATSIPWTAQNAAHVSVSPAGLDLTPTATSRVFGYITERPGQTLRLLPGETLTLSFDFRYVAGTPDNEVNELRFGLFDASGSPRQTSDCASFNPSGLRGYTVHTNPGNTAANQSALYAEDNGPSGSPGASFSAGDGIGTYTNLGGFNAVNAGSQPARAELRVRRNLDGTVTLRSIVTAAGGVADSGERTDSALRLTAFDAVAFMHQAAAGPDTIRLTNVRIEIASAPLVVPDPLVTSSLAASTGVGQPFAYTVTGNQQIVADFSGAPSEVDGYPGVNGRGWVGGWSVQQTSATVTDVVVAASQPLVPGGGPYLAAVFTALDANKRAFVTRTYGDAPARGIGLTAPHRIEFDIRPENAGAVNNRLWIFDRPASTAVPSPEANTDLTWAIRSAGLQPDWRLYNGGDVPSGVRVLEGRTYRFAIDVNPAARTFRATITNLDFQAGDPGVPSFSSGPVSFRSPAQTVSGRLHFGTTFTNVGPSPAIALDRVAVRPPAVTFGAVGLPAGLTIDPVTGLISGTPTTAGVFPVQLTVTEGARVGTATLNLTVHAAPSVAIIGVEPRTDSYEVSFAASAGGTSPVVATTWELGDGTVRSGLAVAHAYAAPGSYAVTFRATNAAGLSAEVTTNVVVAETALAEGWSAGPIGQPGRGGSAAYEATGEVTTIVGGGAGFGAAADAAQGTWRLASGNFNALVRLDSLVAAEGGMLAADASAGLVLRDSVEAEAIGVALTVAGDGTVRLAWRTVNGGAAAVTEFDPVTLAQWLLLLRSGGTTTAYLSEDGLHFSPLATVAVPLAPEVLVGLAAAGGSATESLVRAQFSGFALVGAMQPGELLASPASDTAIHLGWSDAGAATTIVERLDSGVWTERVRFPGNAVLHYLDTGLEPATAYTYRLQALDGYGVGVPGEPVTARTLIRLDELLALRGLVFTADQVRQPGIRGSGLWFRSEGFLRDGDGTRLLSVWGVFNRTGASRVLTVAALEGGFTRTFTIAPHSAAYVAAPEVVAPAQHGLFENGVEVARRAAADETFVDERLVADEP